MKTVPYRYQQFMVKRIYTYECEKWRTVDENIGVASIWCEYGK